MSRAREIVGRIWGLGRFTGSAGGRPGRPEGVAGRWGLAEERGAPKGKAKVGPFQFGFMIISLSFI